MRMGEEIIGVPQ